MMRAKKSIVNFRITEREAEILRAYADFVGRTQTEIMRDHIRSLEKKLPSEEPPKKKSRKQSEPSDHE